MLILLFALFLTTRLPGIPAVAASAESFDDCHSSSTVSGPGANISPHSSDTGNMFYLLNRFAITQTQGL